MEVLFMRFVIIDLKRRRLSVTVVGILITLLVLISAAVSAVTRIFDEELFLMASTDSNNEKIIIIDAGHGGEDCGAVGVNGVYEKDLNLAVATQVGELLSESGYAVVYTRTEDKLLYLPEENIKGLRKISDLKNRCKIAAEYPEAIFVSIYMNTFGDGRYSGLQVYFSDDSESRELAAKIQDAVRSDLQKDNDRKIKKGEGIYVLENVNNSAVLIECGFLSNEKECEKLSEKEYQKQLSFSIVYGIIEYMNEKYGESVDQ